MTTFTKRARIGLATTLLASAVAAGVATTTSVASAALGDAAEPMIGVSVAHVPNDPGATVKVSALARIGATVFVGGNFTQLAPYLYPASLAGNVPQGQGIDRAYLVAVNAATGNVVWSFAPQLDGAVHALEVDPATNTLYVGGDFDTVGGQALSNFAILDATTGALKAGVTQLPANGDVLALHRHALSSKLYLGGNFTDLGGRNRGEAARLSLPGNTVDNWKVQVTGRVLAVATDPDAASPAAIYLGGEFENVVGAADTMDFVASFSAAEPAAAGDFAPVLPGWDPVLSTTSQNGNAAPRVRSLAVDNGRVLLAAGGNQGRFLVLSAADGAAELAWWRVNGDGQVVEIVDDKILFGGHFEQIQAGSAGLGPRCHVFAVDLANPAAGPLTNPNVINSAHYGAYAIEGWDSDGDGSQETTFWGGHLVRMSQVGGAQACSEGAQNPWGGIWKLKETPDPVDATKPTAPGTPVVSGLFSTPTVSWTPASDANGVAAYYVYVDDALYDVVPGNQTSLAVAALTPETPHSFRVRAVDPSTQFRDSTTTVWMAGQATPSLPNPLNGFGQYVPVNPYRVLDTRIGIGSAGSVVAGADREVQVAGVAGSNVPASGVQLVTLNVTVVSPSANGFLTVYPNGESAPFVSNLNFKAGETVPNLVVARVGTGNKVKVKVSVGDAHVLVDVVGWYGSAQTMAPGSKITTQTPVRVLDTRPAPEKVGPFDKVGSQQTIDVQVVPPGSGVTGVVINLTGTEPTASTFVTAFPGDQATRPEASNLNLVPGQTRPNLVMVRVPTTGPSAGKIRLYNHNGATHLIVDVVATYTASTLGDPSGRVLALTKPLRLLDTRELAGVPGPGTIVRSMANVDASTPASVTGLVVNATATAATNSTFLTLYPTDSAAVPPPTASNLNVKPGQDVPNLAVASLTNADNLGVYNLTGTVHYVLDLTALVVA